MPSGRIVVEVSSTVRSPGISARRVRELVSATLESDRIRDAMISVAFVGRRAMAGLNEKYLGHDGATDVISFGMGRETSAMPAVGDIYICPEVAARNAALHGTTVRNELSRLVVHGTLHVAGHDHPNDESRMSSPMWAKQERILARHG